MKSEGNDLWGLLFKVETNASTMVDDGSLGDPKMMMSLSSEGVRDRGITISSSSGSVQRGLGVLGVFVGRRGSLSILGSPENRFNSRKKLLQVEYGGFPMWVYKNKKILKANTLKTEALPVK